MVINNNRYPNIVDSKEPDKTPILTPSTYCVFSRNAKFPTNRLMVKPIPVNTPTPYKFYQFELLGICAIFNFIETIENKNTPICFPKNNPHKIPKGTGSNKVLNEIPLSETPAFARANRGMIPKAT